MHAGVTAKPLGIPRRRIVNVRARGMAADRVHISSREGAPAAGIAYPFRFVDPLRQQVVYMLRKLKIGIR